MIPGLSGYPGLLMSAAPTIFPNFRAIPFDHRQRPAEHGVEALAEQALSVLDANLGIDQPAYVCGESFGGTIALTLARRYPSRVRGLVLMSTFGRYPPHRARGGRAGLAAWGLLGDPVAVRVLRLSRVCGVPGTLGWRFTREMLRAYLGHPDGVPAAYRSKCLASVRFDATPWLGSLTCPSLVMTGSWDPIVPTRSGDELARLLPNAVLHRLPGGHAFYLTRPAEAGAVVAGWVRRNERDGSRRL